MPELMLPYPPSANRYWRNFKGRTVVSDEAKAFKRTAFVLAKSKGFAPLDGPVLVVVTLHPPGAKSLDLDNALKIVLDSLQGVAYSNDDQIVEIRARRAEPIKGGMLVVEWTRDDNHEGNC